MKTIKLDFDGSEIDFLKHIDRIKNALSIIGFIKLVDVVVMQTKKGFHSYLTVDSPNAELTALDLVTLQSLFGSDYKRECFNYLRVKSGMILNENWNVLFNQKWNGNGGTKEVLSQETPRNELRVLFFK